jgi:hypothetical protein
MTVKELIKKLLNFPMDANVYVDMEEGYIRPVVGVKNITGGRESEEVLLT